MTITIDVLPEDVVKLLLALLVGGLIGAEREYRDKAAGFRTMIFISVGSALFTMLSLKLASDGDPARIAAQIVSGVGFLGGGAILRGDGRIHGLTTAATIWLVAALGMGIGGELYAVTLIATGIILVVLWIFPVFEHWIDNVRHTEIYEIESQVNPATFESLRKLFESHKLRIIRVKRHKVNGNMISLWEVHGAPQGHNALTDALLAHDEVIGFQV